MSGKRFSIRPGGALEGTLFSGFLRHLTEIRELKPGKRLGPWRIIRELGRGGSGVVYLAERADGAFAQEVALKWLRGDRPAFGGRQALERERELLAGLDHPNIARLIDGGQTDDGMLWFAMDYVPGERIDEHARGLTLRERIELIRVLCQAAHYAHSRGLIHGDIKPANVIVGDRGEPRLLDFGIARLQGADGGGYGLTPDFASPEQRDGGALTTASDIWQLGRLLEALLRGQAVPKDINLIVEKATAEDPGERYSSVAALESDLLAWQQQRPVMARGGGAGYRLTSYFRRYRALSSLTVAAFLIIAGGGGWFAWRLAQERDLAQAALGETESALARAESFREFLLDLFSATRPNRPFHEFPSTEEILALGAERAMDPETGEPAERTGMLLTIADVYLQYHKINRALPLLEEAVSLARDNEQFDDLARALSPQITIAMHRGDMQTAVRLLQEAESAAQHSSVSWDTRAWVVTRRAFLAYRQGDNERRLALLKSLYAEMQAQSEVSDSVRVEIVSALGDAHMESGELSLASELTMQRLELTRQISGEESLGYFNSLRNIALVQRLRGIFSESETYLRQSLDILDQLFDGPSTYRAVAQRQLADTFMDMGRFSDALKEIEASGFESAKAVGRTLEKHEHYYYRRGLLHAGMWRWEAAAADLTRARELYAGDRRQPMALDIQLARALCSQGRPEEGTRILSDLSEGLPELPGQRADLLEARAACEFQAGESERALASIEHSLAVPDPTASFVTRAGRELLRAQVLASLGRTGEAADVLGEAEQRFLRLGLDNHPHMAEIRAARQQLTSR